MPVCAGRQQTDPVERILDTVIEGALWPPSTKSGNSASDGSTMWCDRVATRTNGMSRNRHAHAMHQVRALLVAPFRSLYEQRANDR
jgi:hypothetical protein